MAVRYLLDSPLRRNRTIGVILAVVLGVAMMLGTKFVSASASAEGQPKAFSAAEYAEQKWPDLVAGLQQKAIDAPTLAAAVDANLAQAGKQYGQNLGAGSYAFPIKATGTVSAVDNNFITLSVPKMPAGDTVRIPLGLALSGLPLRDATGLIKFGDFTNQTDYQSVANALQVLAREKVLSKITPAQLKGKQITVIGAYGTGGPPRSYSINPVQIEVAP